VCVAMCCGLIVLVCYCRGFGLLLTCWHVPNARVSPQYDGGRVQHTVAEDGERRNFVPHLQCTVRCVGDLCASPCCMRQFGHHSVSKNL